MRFDPTYKGPGLKIRDVIPQGPTDEARSRLQKEEVILEIDGRAVDPAMDLTQVLNGPAARDIRLKVKGLDGKEREVTCGRSRTTRSRACSTKNGFAIRGASSKA